MFSGHCSYKLFIEILHISHIIFTVFIFKFQTILLENSQWAPEVNALGLKAVGARTFENKPSKVTSEVTSFWS